MKICKICLIDLDESNFRIRNKKIIPPVLTIVCKSCEKRRILEKAEEKRERISKITEKTCSKCKILKPIQEFGKNKANYTGHTSHCKMCSKVSDRERRIRYISVLHKSKRKEMGDFWKTQLVNGAKYRCSKQNIPFNITKEDIIVNEFCPVLGLKLEAGRGLYQGNNSATLDRINPSLGYVKGNVQIISWLANRLKSNHTDPETFIKIANYLKSHQNHLDTLDETATFTLSLPG